MIKSLSSFLRLLYDLAILLLFVAIFVAAWYYREAGISLIISVSLCICYAFSRLSKFKPTPSYIHIITIIAFIAFAILLLSKPFIEQYIEYGTLFFEILFVVVLWVIGFLKSKTKNLFIKEGKMKIVKVSVRVNEFFRMISLCKIVFTIHLLIVGIYYFYLRAYHSPELTKFLFSQLVLCLIFIIIVYEHIRIYMLYKEMNAEVWLPIMNESGKVIGKVAHSVAKTTKQQFLFPVVRIALLCDNMLYLSKRKHETIVEPDKIDIPFERYLKYGQTLDDAVKQILSGSANFKNLTAKFVFKYVCKSPAAHRLIYLYVVQVPSHQYVDNLNLMEGKWWYEKQIEENLNKGLFSEFFEKEYEVLRNTILLANKAINKSFYKKNSK